MIHPERWIAVLRIVVGGWFLKSCVTKLDGSLAGGIIPYPHASARWAGFMPTRLAEYAAGNPIGWYRRFLEDVAIPNADLFANLTALGETAVGIGLTLGLLTPPAAAIGLLLVLSYGLSNFWVGVSQQGFHLLLATSMLIFIGARAGRTWGLDAVLLRRRMARAARRR